MNFNLEEIALKKKEIYDILDSSPKGLSSQEVASRIIKYGKNELIIHRITPWYILLGKEFMELFPLLLLFASILSFFIHSISPKEGYDIISYALLGVVIINALFSFFQKHKVEKVMEHFMKYLPQKVVVLRDNEEEEVEITQLVPGDIIKLQEGDKIPADCIVIESEELRVDESILTGESSPIRKEAIGCKNVKDCIIYSGTSVIRGEVTAIVVNTGKNTRFASISHLTQSVKHDLTPMQKEIKVFVRKITYIALSVGIIFFVLGIFLKQSFWTNIVFAIGIIVANVPEGLLPTITLALTQASQRMAKKNALVKRIVSVETLGSTTVICTDKTGTLTQNKLKVVKLFLNMKEISYDKEWVLNIKTNPAKNIAFNVLSLCNKTELVVEEDLSKRYVGDHTEISLREFVDSIENSEEIKKNFKLIAEKPFSSEDKFMVTVHKNDKFENYVSVKGAPEVVLEMCKDIYLDGKIRRLTDKEKKEIEKHYKKFAGGGLRVLGLAYATRSVYLDRPKNLIFLGLVGMRDPPREEVFEAVKLCKKAGIKIIVISGDRSETVKAIASEVGISDNPTIITGDILKDMSEESLCEILKTKEILFARTLPEQKFMIVNALKKNGEVVAVTGDGVNDAPAIKRADIGISMGSGTDVAKEVADVILLDDNFATIVSAIQEGRTVYDNIKKFITYILTSNIPEIFPFIAYVLFPIPLPLTIIQILSIDLVTDMLPAIGLGNETSEKDVMTRPPRKEKLVTAKTFLTSYGIIGPLEALFAFVVFFTILFYGGWRYGAQLDNSTSLYMQATGAFLATIIFCQIGNVMGCRTNRESALRRINRWNPWIFGGIVFEIVFIFAIINIPVFWNIFSTHPLPMWVWLMMIPAPFLIFFAEEVRKLLGRKGIKFFSI